jgi:hypothetical protein
VFDERVEASAGVSGAHHVGGIAPRREAIETAYALKQLITAGVRVWFYLENRERTLDTPTDKLLMSVTAFADELERENARQRTYDAMARKARRKRSAAVDTGASSGAGANGSGSSYVDADGERLSTAPSRRNVAVSAFTVVRPTSKLPQHLVGLVLVGSACSHA